MPRLVHKAPSYREHKASGNAVVTINGGDIYLGEYKSPASRQKYDRIIKEWKANHGTVTKPAGRRPRATEGSDTSVAELLLAFWDYAQEHYQRDGKSTSEQANFRPIIRMLRLSYGNNPASEFGAIALRAMRQQMIDAGWTLSGGTSLINVDRAIAPRYRYSTQWPACCTLSWSGC